MNIPSMAAAVMLVSSSLVPAATAGEDPRVMVELPPMMQQHMMRNMRDHLAAIDEILAAIAEGDLDGAADIAEARLGMTSLESHGAAHMAGFMPEGMREAGNGMHRAASRFARVAQEGESSVAYRALAAVTSACVACHSQYRIR